MTALLLIWNLRALARILLGLRKPETQMPDQPDDQRSPKEAAQLARETMRRMIATPPKPHEKMTTKKPKKKSRRK
ncbi:MAG: hypothetical protein WAN26_14060 [Steroidobacteraceae bacterium]